MGRNDAERASPTTKARKKTQEVLDKIDTTVKEYEEYEQAVRPRSGL